MVRTFLSSWFCSLDSSNERRIEHWNQNNLSIEDLLLFNEKATELAKPRLVQAKIITIIIYICKKCSLYFCAYFSSFFYCVLHTHFCF